jgi:hypothetical protein
VRSDWELKRYYRRRVYKLENLEFSVFLTGQVSQISGHSDQFDHQRSQRRVLLRSKIVLEEAGSKKDLAKPEHNSQHSQRFCLVQLIELRLPYIYYLRLISTRTET